MKLFGPECNNLCEADVKGLFVNLLATLALPVEPGQEKFEVEHQKLIVNGLMNGSEPDRYVLTRIFKRLFHVHLLKIFLISELKVMIRLIYPIF